MEINEKILENQIFINFLEAECNNVIYLKYLYEPNEKNSTDLNEAFKNYERQIIMKSYLKKVIYFEARKFDEKIRSKEKRNTSIDIEVEGGSTLGDFLVDEKNEQIFKQTTDVNLEELFEDIRLYHAITNLTHKQRKILYLLYLNELSEKEIAQLLSVTQQAISKIHRTAIKKLREVMMR